LAFGNLTFGNLAFGNLAFGNLAFGNLVFDIESNLSLSLLNVHSWGHTKTCVRDRMGQHKSTNYEKLFSFF
jgi:hypothetical protein